MSKNIARILIVEDDKLFRDTIAEFLESRDYVVIKASSGFAALEILESNRFDVIITDINMPDGNGLELLNAVRRTNPDMPNVIIVTGNPEDVDLKLLSRGSHAVFRKPFDTKEFLNSIEQVVNSRPAANKSV